MTDPARNRTTALSLMVPDVPGISVDMPLADVARAMSMEDASLAYLVWDKDGKPLGMLAAEKIITFVLEGMADALNTGTIPAGLRIRFRISLRDVPLEAPVSLSPEDSLPQMLLRSRDACCEWLPVIDGEAVIGRVKLNDIYTATATLALGGDSRDSLGPAGSDNS